MHTYRYAPATEQDFETLRLIHREAMTPSVTRAMGAWDDEQQVARLRRHFQPQHLRFVYESGALAGCVHVSRTPGAHFLEQFYLRPGFQGTGLGSALMADVLCAAAAEGACVTLHVLKESPARAFYERHGFVVTGGDEWQDYMTWGHVTVP